MVTSGNRRRAKVVLAALVTLSQTLNATFGRAEQPGLDALLEEGVGKLLRLAGDRHAVLVFFLLNDRSRFLVGEGSAVNGLLGCANQLH